MVGSSNDTGGQCVAIWTEKLAIRRKRRSFGECVETKKRPSGWPGLSPLAPYCAALVVEETAQFARARGVFEFA